MKKIICIALISIMAIGTLTACGSDNGVKPAATTQQATSDEATKKPAEEKSNAEATKNSESKASSEKEESKKEESKKEDSVNSDYVDPTVEAENKAVESMADAFQPPAKTIKIDKKKDDPSTKSIKFEYDDKGRISKCYYDANNMSLYLSYAYYENDKVVEIYGFSDSTVISDVIYDYKSYDKNAGFVEYDGYYFKNLKF